MGIIPSPAPSLASAAACGALQAFERSVFPSFCLRTAIASFARGIATLRQIRAFPRHRVRASARAGRCHPPTYSRTASKTKGLSWSGKRSRYRAMRVMPSDSR